MELNNIIVDKMINRLLENEKHKSLLEEKLQVSIIDLLKYSSCETCFNLLFNKKNGLFFNKEEKLYMLERVLETEELVNVLSNKNLKSFPMYLIKPICKGIIKKYPEKIIDLIKNNRILFENYLDKFGFNAEEKQYISSIIIIDKLN